VARDVALPLALGVSLGDGAALVRCVRDVLRDCDGLPVVEGLLVAVVLGTREPEAVIVMLLVCDWLGVTGDAVAVWLGLCDAVAAAVLVTELLGVVLCEGPHASFVAKRAIPA
jgi:hypothetical protein